MAFVVRYPDGRFQGYPRSGSVKNRWSTKTHPLVDSLDDARIYPTKTAATNSIAHNGGAVVMVAVVLLESKEWEPSSS